MPPPSVTSEMRGGGGRGKGKGERELVLLGGVLDGKTGTRFPTLLWNVFGGQDVQGEVHHHVPRQRNARWRGETPPKVEIAGTEL